MQASREVCMGNTCASVHIALTAAKPDPVNVIIRAYSTIGFRTDEDAVR
jgi:hypothetical protein